MEQREKKRNDSFPCVRVCSSKYLFIICSTQSHEWTHLLALINLIYYRCIRISCYTRITLMWIVDTYKYIYIEKNSKKSLLLSSNSEKCSYSYIYMHKYIFIKESHLKCFSTFLFVFFIVRGTAFSIYMYTYRRWGGACMRCWC